MTPKEEQFCKEYVITRDGADAYSYAYNTTRLKPETIERKAITLLNRGDIQHEIKKITPSQRLIDSFEERYLSDTPRPSFKKIDKSDGPNHGNATELEHIASLSKASGSPDPIFMDMLVRQLSKVVEEDLDILSLNEMMSAMAGISPQDEVEGMLAAQMVAVHTAIMHQAGEIFNKPSFLFQNHSATFITKLMRTFTQQIETLTKYRGQGHQRMTVEHVHVHSGGQAIVGQVNKGCQKNERNNLMSKICGAKTRSGGPCQTPAMTNGRCRSHGGLSTGAPKGNRNAWKHGYYSAAAAGQRKLMRNLLESCGDNLTADRNRLV
jgi:hypothetical protein